MKKKYNNSNKKTDTHKSNKHVLKEFQIKLGTNNFLRNLDMNKSNDAARDGLQIKIQ